ncbi:MAG: hypothetical protein ACNA76_08730 [Anaerosomatales bacterium]
MHRNLEGPAGYFAEHPLAYVLSLAASGAAVSIFATRAACSRGPRRLGWIALFALEAAIFIGIVVVREEAHRALQHEGPRTGQA